MSWFAQVRHVLAKDVRAQRWLLLAFYVLLAMSAAAVLTDGRRGDAAVAVTDAPHTNTYDPSDAAQTLEYSSERMIASSSDAAREVSLEPVGLPFAEFLAPLIAVLLCALLVLADHPTQPRAQWASLPYDRSAMWGAKLCFVVVLAASFALAQSVPLFVLQLPVADIPAKVGGSAIVMLTFCVTALLLATASSDLRMVIFLVLLLLVASLLSGILLSTRADGWVVPKLVATISRPAIVIASLWWLYLVYRSRHSVMRIRMGSFGLAALMFAPAKLEMLSPSDAQRTLSEIFPGAVVTSRLEAQRSATSDSLSFIWHVSSSGIPSTIRITYQHGSAVAASVPTECTSMYRGFQNPPNRTLQSPPLPLDRNLRWPAGGAPTTGESLPSSQVAWTGRAETPEATCAARGWPIQLVLTEPVVFAELPLQTGARVTNRGQRVTVREAPARGANRAATVLTTSVAPGTLCNYDAPTFVLVNRVKQEAVLLSSSSQSSGFGGQLCMTSHVFPLASDGARATPWSVLGKPPLEEFDAWLRDAQLVVIEWRSRGIVSVSSSSAEVTQP